MVLAILPRMQALRRSEGNKRIRRDLAENKTAKIVGGQDALDSRFPYYVAILDESDQLYCGGSLVAPDIVLTAAHCFRELSLPMVMVGGEETFSVVSSFIHDGFNLTSKENDVMLFRIDGESTKSPLRINYRTTIPENGGDTITVIGKGLLSMQNQELPHSLQEVQVGYVPYDECLNSVGLTVDYRNTIKKDMICVKEGNFQDGFKGFCSGDSGGK
jgi:secreted trypsin-like serine protease